MREEHGDRAPPPPCVTHKPMPRRQQRRHTERQSANTQTDQDDIPERTPVVQEREIKIVQAVIQPAVPSSAPILPRHRPEVRTR